MRAELPVSLPTGHSIGHQNLASLIPVLMVSFRTTDSYPPPGHTHKDPAFPYVSAARPGAFY